MARIITLGCKVLDVRRRYAKIHETLFGVSVRRVINLVRGRECSVCQSCITDISALERELRSIQADIEDLPAEEHTAREAESLLTALLGYIETLLQTMMNLQQICRKLVEEGDSYRNSSTATPSRFQHDKIDYDYSLRELETLSTKLNHLFSSY